MLPVYVYLYKEAHNRWNGSHFHTYEMGLSLRSMGAVVSAVFRNHTDAKVFETRYTEPLCYITDVNTIKVKHALLTFQPPVIQFPHCRRILHITTDEEQKKWLGYLNYQLSQVYSMHLLVPTNLPNTINEIPEKIRKILHSSHIPYHWGISEYIKKTPIRNNGKWLLYTRKDKCFSSEKTIQEAICWCKENNIFVDVDPQFMDTPYLLYEGLIYTKQIDYSGRSPFEFAIVKKPILPFVWSENMKLLTSDQIELRKKIIIRDIPKLNISQEVLNLL